MNTQEQILSLIEDQYSNYRGRLLQSLLFIHSEMRKEMGDEMFLLYLKQQKAINPRPTYTVPKEFLNS